MKIWKSVFIAQNLFSTMQHLTALQAATTRAYTLRHLPLRALRFDGMGPEKIFDSRRLNHNFPCFLEYQTVNI